MSDGGVGGGGDGGEGWLRKDRPSERHISSRLRRSDTVKRVCWKWKREGKGVGRGSGGGRLNFSLFPTLANAAMHQRGN